MRNISFWGDHSGRVGQPFGAYSPTKLPIWRPARGTSGSSTLPKRGSWRNLAETAFSKRACRFLRHIRVFAKAELKERILKRIVQWNEQPVVLRWSYFYCGITKPWYWILVGETIHEHAPKEPCVSRSRLFFIGFVWRQFCL